MGLILVCSPGGQDIQPEGKPPHLLLMKSMEQHLRRCPSFHQAGCSPSGFQNTAPALTYNRPAYSPLGAQQSVTSLSNQILFEWQLYYGICI